MKKFLVHTLIVLAIVYRSLRVWTMKSHPFTCIPRKLYLRLSPLVPKQDFPRAKNAPIAEKF